jgi:hypothetical protein
MALADPGYSQMEMGLAGSHRDSQPRKRLNAFREHRQRTIANRDGCEPVGIQSRDMLPDDTAPILGEQIDVLQAKFLYELLQAVSVVEETVGLDVDRFVRAAHAQMIHRMTR